LAQARKASKIEIDYVYDWSSKVTTNNINADFNQEEKVEKKV